MQTAKCTIESAEAARAAMNARARRHRGVGFSIVATRQAGRSLYGVVGYEDDVFLAAMLRNHGNLEIVETVEYK